MLVESFEQASTRQQFADFCQWLKGKMGARAASRKLKSYLAFFNYLDTISAGIPSYVSLLEHFTADGLRRMQTPMSWLKLRYGVEPDAAMREEHSDKRLIDEMIESVPAGEAGDAITGYRSYLQKKLAEGRTTIRSVRMSLRAAFNLLAATSPLFDALPTQKSVTALLTHTPGQAASAQGFIGYLNGTHGFSLSIKVNALAKTRARTHKLEAEMLALYESAAEGESFERAWIKTALMLLHGVARVNKKTMVYVPEAYENQSGFSVSLNAKQYWVPGPADRPSFNAAPTQ
ncbi:hypothetical protein V2K57_15790 [Pseudomonas alliivorans]|nr:hypothetical protein [Pseudomonas alliivorans]MEE4701984.1 hypothetical protein [Pseudomonas alliivorans]MEE4737837.1 hypothetical protein [Pseudomonas alliivorans]